MGWKAPSLSPEAEGRAGEGCCSQDNCSAPVRKAPPPGLPSHSPRVLPCGSCLRTRSHPPVAPASNDVKLLNLLSGTGFAFCPPFASFRSRTICPAGSTFQPRVVLCVCPGGTSPPSRTRTHTSDIASHLSFQGESPCIHISVPVAPGQPVSRFWWPVRLPRPIPISRLSPTSTRETRPGC